MLHWLPENYTKWWLMSSNLLRLCVYQRILYKLITRIRDGHLPDWDKQTVSVLMWRYVSRCSRESIEIYRNLSILHISFPTMSITEMKYLPLVTSILISIVCITTLGFRESKLYFSRFGNIIGMDVNFKDTNLRSVDIICGLRYGSTRRKMLRFMPPVKSLERWLGNRIFSNESLHGVCPQIENVVRKQNQKVYTMARTEDCLSLNLFVPLEQGMITYLSILNSFCSYIIFACLF